MAGITLMFAFSGVMSTMAAVVVGAAVVVVAAAVVAVAAAVVAGAWVVAGATVVTGADSSLDPHAVNTSARATRSTSEPLFRILCIFSPSSTKNAISWAGV